MSKKFNLNSYITSALRKIWQWYPERQEALRRARSVRGAYQCAVCEQIFSRADVQVDHVLPVVRKNGTGSWDEYIERLFCSVENLQVCCKPCHHEKTIKERQLLRKGT